MNKLDFNKVIFLLLLNNLGGKDYVHSIIRTLTRRFEVWDFMEVINIALNEQLVTRIKIDKIDGFEITEKGKKILEANSFQLHENLSSKFQNQTAFINLLFKNK